LQQHGRVYFSPVFAAFMSRASLGITGLRVDLSFFGDNRFIAGIPLH
jgi:hypothetical protein